MICNEFDAENAEKTERNLDEVFFERGKKINMHETNAITQKRTQENFI